MGTKKYALIQKKARIGHQKILKDLETVLLSIFFPEKEVNTIEFPDFFTAHLLADLVNMSVRIHDPQNTQYFCANNVLSKKVILSQNRTLQFWGIIYWLQTPASYTVNKNDSDPLYAEFVLVNQKLSLKKLCFGDWDALNLNEHDWFNMDLDWIYQFNSFS